MKIFMGPVIHPPVVEVVLQLLYLCQENACNFISVDTSLLHFRSRTCFHIHCI